MDRNHCSNIFYCYKGCRDEFLCKGESKSKDVEFFLYTGSIKFTSAGKADSWCLSLGESLKYKECCGKEIQHGSAVSGRKKIFRSKQLRSGKRLLFVKEGINS